MRLFKYAYLPGPSSFPDRFRARRDPRVPRLETPPGSPPGLPRYGLVSQTLLGPGLDSRAGQTAMQAAPWQIRVGLGVRLQLGPREALRPQLAVNLIQVRPPLLGLHLAG